MSREDQLRFRSAALAIQHRLGIGKRLMGIVAPLLFAEVHCRIAACIRWWSTWPLAFLLLRLKALLPCPCFDQGAVHSEVLIRQQLLRPRLTHHIGQELF